MSPGHILSPAAFGGLPLPPFFDLLFIMPAAMAGRIYPFPFRTRKSSAPAPMILPTGGKVGRRRLFSFFSVCPLHWRGLFFARPVLPAGRGGRLGCGCQALSSLACCFSSSFFRTFRYSLFSGILHMAVVVMPYSGKINPCGELFSAGGFPVLLGFVLFAFHPAPVCVACMLS